METFLIVAQVLLGLFSVQSGLMHFAKMKVMTSFAKAKNLPEPQAAVMLSGFALLLGGLSVLSGRFIQYGLWILVGFLLLASVLMHNFWSEKNAEKKMTDMHFFMGNMALTLALVMLMGMVNSWPLTF